MARPRKHGLDYFPHDVDAVNDEKIEVMRTLYGNDGYAFYFIALERIYRTEIGALDIGTEIKRAALAAKIGVPSDRLVAMLETAFEVGLFDNDIFQSTGNLTSNGVKSRFGVVQAERDRKRGNGSYSNDNAGNSGIIDVDNSGIAAERKEKEKVKKDTPTTPMGVSRRKGSSYEPIEFRTYWQQYPRKVVKTAALKAWMKLNPEEDTIHAIMYGLERAKQTEQWRKEGGQFIPYPSTYLNQRRWEDEGLPEQRKDRFSDVKK